MMPYPEAMRHFVLISACLAAVLSSGCAVHSSDVSKLPVEAFSGHILTTAQGTWFTPCGADAASTRWWVTYVDAAVKQSQAARASGQLATGERAFVRWRASRTDERLVGPGGPALLVRDIFEIRPPGPADCSRPSH